MLTKREVFWIKVQRAYCYLFHWQGQQRWNGLGWRGWHCTRCGWTFFHEWER